MHYPEITKTETVYNGNSISCAMIIIHDESEYVFKNAIKEGIDDATGTGNYVLQFVANCGEEKEFTITCGSDVRSVNLTRTLTRYVLTFENIRPADSNYSLRFSFPASTKTNGDQYIFTNLQIEAATNASPWRPAPEDAEDKAQDIVDSQTQLDIFNKLTNNGRVQGLFMQDGQVYFNASYINSGVVSANIVKGGTFTGVSMNIGNGVFVVDENGRVDASNLNITGGTINIDTGKNYTESKIRLNASDGSTYGSEMMPSAFKQTTCIGVGGEDHTITAILGAGDTGALGSPIVIKLDDKIVSSYDVYAGASWSDFGVSHTLKNQSGTVWVAESPSYGIRIGAGGKVRAEYNYTGMDLYNSGTGFSVRLNASGLAFYNSSGTRTCLYRYDGTVVTP